MIDRLKRCWGIRWVRWRVAIVRLNLHMERMQSIGWGIAPHPADVQRLDDIRSGNA